MGASIIRGYQNNDVGDKYHIAACMKHYLGYGDPLSGKDRAPQPGYQTVICASIFYRHLPSC